MDFEPQRVGGRVAGDVNPGLVLHERALAAEGAQAVAGVVLEPVLGTIGAVLRAGQHHQALPVETEAVVVIEVDGIHHALAREGGRAAVDGAKTRDIEAHARDAVARVAVVGKRHGGVHALHAWRHLQGDAHVRAAVATHLVRGRDGAHSTAALVCSRLDLRRAGRAAGGR